ncbi:hypothetical protein F7725_013963 [Dissostichus mawsoni]|uniref:Uncharacterized protein n=1 Tax=Dissostichus mawsoni TaxID=36200 RepID=A0A7J5YUV1_DISMA|nr:hypothetical protein F7725_013963 [Dissostichus mawsoni]
MVDPFIKRRRSLGERLQDSQLVVTEVQVHQFAGFGEGRGVQVLQGHVIHEETETCEREQPGQSLRVQELLQRGQAVKRLLDSQGTHQETQQASLVILLSLGRARLHWNALKPHSHVGSTTLILRNGQGKLHSSTRLRMLARRNAFLVLFLKPPEQRGTRGETRAGGISPCTGLFVRVPPGIHRADRRGAAAPRAQRRAVSLRPVWCQSVSPWKNTCPLARYEEKTPLNAFTIKRTCIIPPYSKHGSAAQPLTGAAAGLQSFTVSAQQRQNDGQSLSEDGSEGDGSFRADQTVSKVYHLNVPQGAGSFVLQPVPPCDEHSQSERRSVSQGLPVARVAGRALQQLLDSLHTVRPEGVIAQVQLRQPGSCSHQSTAQGPLSKALAMARAASTPTVFPSRRRALRP